MKFSYKRYMSDKWKTTTSLEVLKKEISKLGKGVTETLEIKRFCDHENTFVDDGVKCCKDCGEQLEVTSWRD